MRYALLSVLGFSLIFSSCQGGSGTTANLDIFGGDKNASGKTLVKVGDTEIREGFIDSLKEAVPAMKGKLDLPMARKKILESIIDQELLYQEALRQGLDQDPAVAFKSKISTRTLMATALLEKELESVAKEEYEKRKNSDFTRRDISIITFDFLNKEEKKNKTVLTEAHKQNTLKRAQEVEEKLKKGEKFKDLAKQYSDDKRTAKRGGKLGHVAKTDKRLEKEGKAAILEKAFALKTDEVSAPIEIQDGYAIIRIDSEPKVTPFDKAKQFLTQELQNKVKDDVLAKLKKDRPVEFVQKDDESTKSELKKMDKSQSEKDKVDAALKKIEGLPKNKDGKIGAPKPAGQSENK